MMINDGGAGMMTGPRKGLPLPQGPIVGGYNSLSTAVGLLPVPALQPPPLLPPFGGVAAVTAATRPSPIDASACGASEPLRLVPFGSTNIRIAVFPWVGLGGGNFSVEAEVELRHAE